MKLFWNNYREFLRNRGIVESHNRIIVELLDFVEDFGTKINELKKGNGRR